MSLLEINKKYTELAVIDCGPLCGSALKYADAQVNEVCVVLGNGQRTEADELSRIVGEKGTVYLIDENDFSSENGSLKREEVYNIIYLRTSFERINLGDETADLVIANCTIHQSARKQEVWHEIFRILKKGGRFMVTDHYSADSFPQTLKSKPVTAGEYLDHLDRAGFSTLTILEESSISLKEEGMVASWTISGIKPLIECDWCGW